MNILNDNFMIIFKILANVSNQLDIVGMTGYFLKVPLSAQAGEGGGGGGGGGARMIWSRMNWVLAGGDRSGFQTAGPLYHNSTPWRAGDEPRTPHRGADISGLNPTTDTHPTSYQPQHAGRGRGNMGVEGGTY